MLFMFTIDLFVQLSFLDKHRHEPGYFKVNLHHSECKLFKGNLFIYLIYYYFIDSLLLFLSEMLYMRKINETTYNSNV